MIFISQASMLTDISVKLKHFFRSGLAVWGTRHLGSGPRVEDVLLVICGFEAKGFEVLKEGSLREHRKAVGGSSGIHINLKAFRSTVWHFRVLKRGSGCFC